MNGFNIIERLIDSNQTIVAKWTLIFDEYENYKIIVTENTKGLWLLHENCLNNAFHSTNINHKLTEYRNIDAPLKRLHSFLHILNSVNAKDFKFSNLIDCMNNFEFNKSHDFLWGSDLILLCERNMFLLQQCNFKRNRIRNHLLLLNWFEPES